MAQGRASEKLGTGVVRPKSETLHWSAAIATFFVVVGLATRDAGHFWGAIAFAALALQTRQRIEISGGQLRRIGLRPAEVDLRSAELVHRGSSWWRELLFCGPMLQVRDAEGRKLYIEAWLWPLELRTALVEAVAGSSEPV